MNQLKHMNHRREQIEECDEGSRKVTRRLNVNLPTEVFQELVTLAELSGRTLTEIVRLGFGLVNLAIQEGRKGNRLAVVDERGRILKEVVLPM